MRKTKIVSMIVLLVGLSFNVCHATPTLLKSLTVHGHTYALYSEPQVTWDSAKEFAYALGDDWTLATITSLQEQIVVSTLIACKGVEFWLGGFQNPIEGDYYNQWMWDTGDDMIYTHWNPSEPNDFYGPNSEQYMAMWASGFGMFGWNDEGNLRNISGFVAEQTPVPVPEPSTLLLLGGGMIALAGLQRKGLKTLSHRPR